MRRSFLTALPVIALASVVVALLSVSSAADLPQSAKRWRIGVLAVGDAEALRKRLSELGYVEGQNVIYEIRDTKEGRPEFLKQLASELVDLKVDVIVALYPAAVFAAKRATTAIPIVMVMSPDPVQLGVVASLAQPDANVTGTTTLSVDLSIKHLELIKEAVPRASRIVVLWNPDNPWHPLVVRSLPKENRRLGVELQFLEIRVPADINDAFQTMVRERVDALIVLSDPLMTAHRREVAALAAKHHLPSIGGPRSYTEAGGLMSYWADEDELLRRAASYVDKILKGASPQRLPIEQPGKYDLFVNLKTAKTLGLTIPKSQLMRATVIE